MLRSAGMLAVPRDSAEIQAIEQPEYDEEGEPRPELLVLDTCARPPLLGGPAGCWCPPFYPAKAACWLCTVWLIAGVLRLLVELSVRSEIDCP